MIAVRGVAMPLPFARIAMTMMLSSMISVPALAAEQCVEITRHSDGSITSRYVQAPPDGVATARAGGLASRSAASTVSVASSSSGGAHSSASSATDADGRRVEATRDDRGCRIVITEQR
jgi:hypothetical protein